MMSIIRSHTLSFSFSYRECIVMERCRRLERTSTCDVATFIISQPRPSSRRGTSRRSLIRSWTTLTRDIRGTLHWFHSRELLWMLSVDKLYFKTFHNERLLPGDGPLIGYAQCAPYYHRRIEGDGRDRPWVPKVLSWQTYRWNDFVQQQPESSSTQRHSNEWFITIEQNHWIDIFLVILNASRGGVQQGPLKDRRFLMRTTRYKVYRALYGRQRVQEDPPIGRILQRYWESHHSFVLCAFGRSVCSFRSVHQMMTYNSILPLV